MYSSRLFSLLSVTIDFYRFLLIDNNQLNYFFSILNLYRFSISIDNNRWIKSIYFRFRLLSINYAWYKNPSYCKIFNTPKPNPETLPPLPEKMDSDDFRPTPFYSCQRKGNRLLPCSVEFYRARGKKVPSGSLGQVDFLAGQVTIFSAYLPNGQSSRQVIL